MHDCADKQVDGVSNQMAHAPLLSAADRTSGYRQHRLMTPRVILAGALVALAGCDPLPLTVGAGLIGFGTRTLQLDTAVINA